MESPKRAVAILIAIILCTGGQARAMDKAASSGTRSASCIVNITVDPAIFPLTPLTVEHLLYSSGVGGKAARDVLKFDPNDLEIPHNYLENLYEFVEIEWLSDSVRPAGMGLGAPRLGETHIPMPAPGTPTPSPKPMTDAFEEGYHDEMMAEMQSELEAVYGELTGAEKPPRADEPEAQYTTSLRGRSLRSGRSSGRGTRDRSGPEEMMGGRGGYGGGMMGGMRGMYGGPAGPGPAASVERTMAARLLVHLPQEAAPVADQLLKAIVENFRQTLLNAHEQHIRELAGLIDYADSRRAKAEQELDEVLGAGPDKTAEEKRVEQALGTTVDLSELTPEMPAGDAIEVLRNSTEPPLQIAVMWKDLLENAEVEPSTPIDVDGLPRVELETALKIVLKALTDGVVELNYRIEGDVIVIGTEMTQEAEPQPMEEPSVQIDVTELAARRRDLQRSLRSYEMDLAGMEARRQAIQEQIVRIRDETSKKMAEDSVTQELEALVQMNETSLSQLQKQAQTGRLSELELAKGRENLARARIELAKRREELSRSAGGALLTRFNDELSSIAIDMAERRATLDIFRRQLATTEWQLTQASTFDPRAARVRAAREMLDIAERQVTELKTRRANLQPPTVTMIGAN